MSKHTQTVHDSNFDWEVYADGWDGRKQKENKNIRKGKKNNTNDIVYSHEKYAQDLYNKISKVKAVNVKDAKKGDVLQIVDMKLVNDNLLDVAVGNGAASIQVELDKEDNFFKLLSYGGQKLDKESFIHCFKNVPEFKQNLLEFEHHVKLGTDTAKGSIWDAWVDVTTKELKEQIELQNKAYYVTVISTTPGGFVVELNGTIKAFMPGSMASSNKINDYESYVGRTLEVMVESWTPRNGFVVSRKKFINKRKPSLLWELDKKTNDEPNMVFRGKITGSTLFGVFVELDEFITGMLHKSLVSDELREKMRNNEIQIGDEIDVYIARIDHGAGRVILSDVPIELRSEIEMRRKAEDEAEKLEYNEQKRKDRHQYIKESVENTEELINDNNLSDLYVDSVDSAEAEIVSNDENENLIEVGL